MIEDHQLESANEIERAGRQIGGREEGVGY
jgi:hypothetical protein